MSTDIPPMAPQPGQAPYQPPAAPYAPPAPYATPAAYPPAAQPPSQPAPYAPYPAAAYGAPMAPQRNTMLFVASIIMIVGGGVGVLAGLLALLGVGAASAATGVSVGVLLIRLLFALVTAAASLAAGIFGVMNAANPSKAGTLIMYAYVLIAIALISLIITIISGGTLWGGLLSFVLPILYLLGAMNLKKQA